MLAKAFQTFSLMKNLKNSHFKMKVDHLFSPDTIQTAVKKRAKSARLDKRQ